MKAVLVWMAVCVIWGTTWLFIKLGLRDLPPISFAGLRSVMALVALAVLLTVLRKPLPRGRRDWALIALTGLLVFTVNYGLLFWGAQFISSGLTAVLQATIPAFGLVIANYYVPAERMTLARAGAVAMGIVGVVVIFSDQLQLSGWWALLGCLAVVGGALSVAFANVLVKAYGRHLDPATLTAGQMLFGLVPLCVIGFVREGNPLSFRWTPMALASLTYLALIGSAVGFSLYYWLVRHMDVTKAMLTALVTPLLAVLLGSVVLGEALHWRALAGGVLILASVGMVLRRRAIAPIPVEEKALSLASHP